MRLDRASAAALISVLLIMSSCGLLDDDGGIDECVACDATMLSVPDTTLSGQMIQARVMVLLGPMGVTTLSLFGRREWGRHGFCVRLRTIASQSTPLAPRWSFPLE